MICIIDHTTDPYWNLAAEEWLLMHHDEPVFRLWRNDNAVIVGRNQNARAEIDTDFVREHNVAVVRRLTGGGAVFHDLGNVNYTFIDAKIPGEDSHAMFRRFTAPVIEALRKLGVDARLEGRNDLLIGDAKFSGNAICIHEGRVLQHGTLLFSSKMADIAGALIPRKEKYEGRGVKSVRSRVTNISEHLSKPMNVEEFLGFLAGSIASEFTPYNYSEQDLEGIRRLTEEKYRTDAWNYGASPASAFRKAMKFPGGLVEVYMDIKDGCIGSIDIHGDYFFNRPTAEFCEALKGCPHSEEKIAGRLRELATGEYFCGISPEELLQLFF